jgi:hypothetical protein
MARLTGRAFFNPGAFMAYAWQGKDFEGISKVMADRDPEQFTFGYFCEDSSGGCFSWFESRAEMLSFILESEPLIQDLTPEDVVQFKEALAGVLGDIESFELNEDNLDQASEVTEEFGLALDWWGTFGDLKAGTGDWEVALRQAFLEQEEGGDAKLPAEREAEFKKFIVEFPSDAC